MSAAAVRQHFLLCRPLAWTLAACTLAAAGTAGAGQRLPCEEARIFRGAAVNALVLPYRYETNVAFDPQRAGSRLAALVQKELLFSMLKYGSVGATELIATNRSCDAPDVIKRVTTGAGGLQPGQGLLVLWGRIYEEKNEIFVQTYVRFVRGAPREAIRAEVRAGEGPPFALEASLPAQGAALAPRRLTQKDLSHIQYRAEQILVLYSAPNANAPAKRFSATAVEPLSYSVVGTQGEWMQIHSEITGERGWVRVRTDDRDWMLRRFLPELGYAEGIVGYLRLRATERWPLQSPPQRVYEWMRRAFADYEKAVGRDAAPQATGLARSLEGLIVWAQPALGERAHAARLFREALEYLPSSSEARVLAAVSAAGEGTAGSGREALARIDQGLLGAMAVNPASASALANLERLYEAAQHSPALSPYEPDELQERLESVRAARAQAKR
jgi:tetratricopeptide (TPR) repeat protein